VEGTDAALVQRHAGTGVKEKLRGSCAAVPGREQQRRMALQVWRIGAATGA
jgi:hypothetical protein